MEKKDEKILKCANDLKVSITKLNGEILMQEDCCTMIQLVLKNSGEMATSFFGSHNPQIIKILEKALKGYFKSLKKTLKNEYKRTDNEEITVLKDKQNPDGTWEDCSAKETQEDIEHMEEKNSTKNSSCEKNKSEKDKVAQNKKTTKQDKSKYEVSPLKLAPKVNREKRNTSKPKHAKDISSSKDKGIKNNKIK